MTMCFGLHFTLHFFVDYYVTTDHRVVEMHSLVAADRREGWPRTVSWSEPHAVHRRTAQRPRG